MAVSVVVARVVHCQLQPPREGPNSPESSVPDQVKMVRRSKKYTLRSYASDQRRGGLMKGVITTMMMRRKRNKRRRSFDHQDQISGGDDNDRGHDRDHLVRVHDHQVRVEAEEELKLSPILESLVESIESSKKGYYFDIITGRLAMILLAATMGMELATGESIFKTIDAQAIAEGLIGCLAATTCATFFARSSVARKKVGRIFTMSFNVFFEALLDNIIDGLFLESDLDEPSDNNFN